MYPCPMELEDVPPDAQNVERLRHALAEVFEDPDISSITAEDLGGECPAIQYGPPGVDFTIRLRDRDDAQRLARAFGFPLDEEG